MGPNTELMSAVERVCEEKSSRECRIFELRTVRAMSYSNTTSRRCPVGLVDHVQIFVDHYPNVQAFSSSVLGAAVRGQGQGHRTETAIGYFCNFLQPQSGGVTMSKGSILLAPVVAEYSYPILHFISASNRRKARVLEY